MKIGNIKIVSSTRILKINIPSVFVVLVVFCIKNGWVDLKDGSKVGNIIGLNDGLNDGPYSLLDCIEYDFTFG